MRTRTIAALLAAALTALLLAGCQGRPLPSGMDEAALLDAGRDVMLQLVAGEYDAVYAALRSDVAEGTSAEAIGELVLRQLEGAGTYKQIDSSMVTGQTSDGESYGVAVTSRLTGETASVRHITASIPRIDALCELLARGQVGPAHLRDVIEDWL